MKPPGPIWVDDRNPIYRRGLIKCLENEGYVIAGESAGLRPLPELSRSSVLIFDLDAAGPEVAATLANRCALTIGLVREMPAGQVRELLAKGLSVALPLRTLTPANLLACLRTHGKVKVAQPALNGAVAGNGAGGRHLTRRELDVLSLLADGDTTREIAAAAELLGAHREEHRSRRARQAGRTYARPRGRARLTPRAHLMATP